MRTINHAVVSAAPVLPIRCTEHQDSIDSTVRLIGVGRFGLAKGGAPLPTCPILFPNRITASLSLSNSSR